MKRNQSSLRRYFGNFLLIVGFIGGTGAADVLGQRVAPLSIIRRPTGDFFLAVRRAPDRKVFGEPKSNHVDPNSYLVGLSSEDGENWNSAPELIYAHPFGGSQDPCLLQLSDGTILCTSYAWAFLRPSGILNLKKPYFEAGGAHFLGGYLLSSSDGAKTWQGPVYPPHIAPEINFSALGNPLPAYNRGALCEGKDGRVFWVVAATDKETPKKTSNHLLISDDKGLTWKYASEVAKDDSVTFNEASV
jgi:sialidase-1